MLKIENVEVFGWEGAIRGMRNPKNSWDRSDSKTIATLEDGKVVVRYEIGPNDLKLAKALVAGGSVHCKFRRQIMVTLDITAPMFWWKEFDTYKVGTVRDSCSTMHKITSKPFEVSDFSVETIEGYCPHESEFSYMSGLPLNSRRALEYTIAALNNLRELYLKAKADGAEDEAKIYWRKIIELLPSSYNQKSTVTLNYEVLANIRKWRCGHKLYEWSKTMCGWIDTLPYAKELIIGPVLGEED